jgi:flagellar capping protein FliD
MASTLFNGTSRYSTDFSAVIERSVGIASLALTQMQQQRARSSDQVNALKLLEFKVLSLQGTIKAVEESVTTKGALQTTSSNTTLVRPTSTDGVVAGSYTMRVVSLGSFSTAVSKTDGKPAVSDPDTGSFVTESTTKLTLRIVDHDTVGAPPEDIVIDLSSGTSLQDVVGAVNSQAGSKVQAAIVNVGSTSAPNYALSLQSTKLGKLGIQLKEGDPPPVDTSGDLMNVDETDADDASVGYLAEYKLNGANVRSDSRTVTIAPNLTVELLKADTSDVTVKVSQTTSAFTTAVGNFISAYNAVLADLDAHTAEGGALVGNSIVSSIRQQLRTAVNFVLPSGDLTSLAKVGIELTRTGQLSFNATLFNQETEGQFAALTELVGTSSTSGFVKMASDALNAIETTTGGGFLADTVASLESSLKAEDARIAAEQSRIEQFTRDLQERMAKADAMIAQLEQQAEYFNSMFEAMRINQKSFSA